MNLEKYHFPSPTGILERERLFAKLASWDDRKLVIIRGPAGQGKSTLAADYARSQHDVTLWYTLEASDDDPALFLDRFGLAVQRGFPGAFSAVPAAPRNRSRPGDPPPAFAQWIARLFQDIPSALVVFDDYHAVGASPTLSALLSLIIETTPPAVRIMVLSRTKPEVLLERFRSTHSIGELCAGDLYFTKTEIHDLFSTIFCIHLTMQETDLLSRVTEGWAVGLALAHEYLLATGKPPIASAFSSLLPEFRSQVFKYLAREVFSHLNAQVQEFLLRTSVTDNIPLPLAALLTGLPVSAGPKQLSVQRMLEEVSSLSLFADPVRGESIIHYHALFREFLARQLAVLKREAEVRRLYETCVGYFISDGDVVRAADLLVSVKQYQQAARLLETSCRKLVGNGQVQTVLRILNGLPLPSRNRPWFLFAQAAACRFSAPRNSLLLYERAFAGFRSSRDAAAQMLALSGIIEACFHSGGDFRRMERAVVRARSLLRKRSRGSRGAQAALLQAVGTASFFTGNLQQGIDALRKAMNLYRSIDDRFSEITCAIYLTPCALYSGDFALAREALRRGFEVQHSAPDEPGGESALHLAKAMADLFEGKFAAAKESLDTCKDLSEKFCMESIELLTLTFSGWLKIAEGDHQNAERLLEACMRRGETSEKAFFSLSAAHFLALSLLFQKKLVKAKQLSDRSLSAKGRSESRLFRAIYLIVSGSIHRELRKHRQAEQDLLTAIRLLRLCKAVQQEANAHLSLALLYLRIRKQEEARNHLKLGFTIGRNHNLTYYALLSPEELSFLARFASEKGIWPDYCSALLEHADFGMQPILRIFCLGNFRVLRNDRQIRERDWKGKQTKQFVKFLLSRTGQPVSRDGIVEAIQPGGEPAAGSALLRNLLHRVRKTLDGKGPRIVDHSCIHYEDGHVSFNRTKVWTDVEAFKNLLTAADIAERGNSGKEALRNYEQALSLYGGDFLPQDLYEEWSSPVRDDLRSRYLHALERAGELADALGETPRAAALQERLFSEDPCNEKACRWLMTRAITDGRRGEAIRTYERCQLALRRELDIEPDEKTRRLFRSIIGR